MAKGFLVLLQPLDHLAMISSMHYRAPKLLQSAFLRTWFICVLDHGYQALLLSQNEWPSHLELAREMISKRYVCVFR